MKHYAFVMLPLAPGCPHLLDWYGMWLQGKEMLNHGAPAHSPASTQFCNDIVGDAEAAYLLLGTQPSLSLGHRVCGGAMIGTAGNSERRRWGTPLRAILLCPFLLALGGCAGFAQKFSDFQRGWRTAEVVAVGRADQIAQKGYTDCRRTDGAAELQASRYAALTYRLGQRQHWHIVKTSPDAAFAPGDMVVANVENCELQIYPLIPVPPSSR